MDRADIESPKPGVLKRRSRRIVGFFVDGVGLDRATRQCPKKVDLQRLITNLTEGISPVVCRYYTLIPHEDDARQFSFLDAVERAGMEAMVKRLPPKGIKRHVAMDVHIASDVMAFSFGHFDAKPVEQKPVEDSQEHHDTGIIHQVKRIAYVICPSRELTYGLYLSSTTGTEISLCDFGLYGSSDGWKGINRWVDLSTSDSIWRD
jgi:hypothetical protein